MSWCLSRGAWVLLAAGCLDVGLCVEPPRGSPSTPLFGRVDSRKSFDFSGKRLHGGNLAWIGSFELLSEDDFFGPKKTAPQQPATATELSPTTPTTPEGESTESGRRPPQQWDDERSTALIDRLSRALGDATDGGARALQTLAERSVVLGREGGVWLRTRWRTKAVYGLAAVYGLRLAGRLLARVKENMLSNGDILLDAEDRVLASRGAILDKEGQALLLRLRALGPPAGGRAANATGAASPQQQSAKSMAHENARNIKGDLADGDVAAGVAGGGAGSGWEAVESSLRHAVSLRYVSKGGRGRSKYAEELSDALRGLEEARDAANMESLGAQHVSLAEQAVLLVQARLSDTCLRSLRDGLVKASSDLSGLFSFWKDQRSTHRRMGVIKSVVLGKLVHGQVSGKRAAVESDQAKVSTSELLLEEYLKRLGTVQAHLQARPTARLMTPDSSSAMTAASGAVLSPNATEALERWVDAGAELLLGSLEHVEAALERQQTTGNGNGEDNGGRHENPTVELDTPLPVDVAGEATAPEHAPSVALATEKGPSVLARPSVLAMGHDAVGDTGSEVHAVSGPVLVQLRGGGSTPLFSGGATIRDLRRSGRQPAVILLGSKPNQSRSASEAEGGGAGRGGAEGSPGEGKSSPSSAAARRPLEEAEGEAGLMADLKGGRRRRSGGGQRWGRIAAMMPGNAGKKRKEKARENKAAGGAGPIPSPLPPPAAALRRPIKRTHGDETAAPERVGGTSSEVFSSNPSSLSSSTTLSTPDVYARALQRNKDYVKNRRVELTGHKRASLGGDGSAVTRPDNEVVSADDTDPSTQGIGKLAACASRCVAACASIAGDMSRGTTAVVSLPARLVGAVLGSTALSKIDLDDDAEEEGVKQVGGSASRLPAQRVFKGVGNSVTNGRPDIPSLDVKVVSSDDTDPSTQAIGKLAACASRCVAACASIAGDMSRGTTAVVSLPARLAGTVFGSTALSKIDLDDNGQEEGEGEKETSASEDSAGPRAPIAKANEGTSEDSDGDETDGSGGALTKRYSLFNWYEKLAMPIAKTANSTFAAMATDGGEGREDAAAEAAAGAVTAGRNNTSEMAARPFHAAAVRPCVYLCELVAAGASACCSGVTACCGRAGGAVGSLGGVALNAGAGALRSARNTTRICVAGAGYLLSSSLKLARAAGERVPSNALPRAGGAAAKAAARLHCRCGHFGFLARKGVFSGCVAATAYACLAGGTVAKVVGKTARVCAGCAGHAGHVAVAAPVKLSRAVVAGGGRAGREAGRGLGYAAGAMAALLGKLSQGLVAGSCSAGLSVGHASEHLSRAVVAGSNRAGRSTAAAVTAGYLVVAATACMLGDAVARGAVKSSKSCLSFVELAGRVLLVLPAEAVARIVVVAFRPFAGGGSSGEKKSVDGEVDSLEGTEKTTRSSSAAEIPVSLVGRFKQWATRAVAYPGALRERRSSEDNPDQPTTAVAAPSHPADPSEAVSDAASPASRAQEAEAALARWVSSAPSEGSGRRSRRLVEGAARAGQITGPKKSATTAGVAGVSRVLRAMAAEEAADAGAARPAHWKRWRRAARLAFVVPVTARSARCAQKNRAELGRVTTEATTGVSSFFSDQLWQPCEAIAKQVFFRERTNLMDKDALDDAETSLQNMLRDFVNDNNNEVPDDLREEAVETMDMSVVSRKLEKETQSSIRGTVNGRIPRMLLIQATFLKKELLHSMQSIDELFQANQVTLRLISVIPAALLIFAGVKVSRPFAHAASSRRLEPTALVHRSMRASLRDIERLLTSSRGFVGSQEIVGEPAGGAGRGLLDDEELGKMALHLHELQTTLRQNRSRFDSRARRRLEEDLADLMARGRPAVSQQLAVLHRMQRSYPFLQAGGGGRTGVGGGGGGGREMRK